MCVSWQGQGVIANAKHFVNNNQETNRGTYVAAVSERAQFELYLPPFEAAVQAGVGSFMCSYNNVSTSLQQAAGQSFWACENEETLTVGEAVHGVGYWLPSCALLNT